MFQGPPLKGARHTVRGSCVGRSGTFFFLTGNPLFTRIMKCGPQESMDGIPGERESDTRYLVRK
jgi:hypothetical protein